MLDKIAVGGGTATQQTVFYTALYHSLLDPSVFSDVNGQYTGVGRHGPHGRGPPDGSVRQLLGLGHLPERDPARGPAGPTTDERHRHLHAQRLRPERSAPQMGEDNGETYIMVGDPADSIIADAYAFGATDFDAQQALTDMETEAEVPSDIRPGLSYYETDGYLPIDGTYGCCNFYGPVSTQQEYDTADNSIAELAADLGDTQVAQTFAVRAQNWQNVFNPGTGFLQPKESGGDVPARLRPHVAERLRRGRLLRLHGHGPLRPERHHRRRRRGRGLGRLPQRPDLQRHRPWARPRSRWATSRPSTSPGSTTTPATRPEPQEVVREIQDQLFTDTPGWPGRQRRPRGHELVVRVVGPGRLPGDARLRRCGPGQSSLSHYYRRPGRR